MAQITITGDLSECLEELKGLGFSDRSNRSYFLTALGREGAKISKKAYRAVGLKKQSGTLYKSITSWINRDHTKAYIGPKRKTNSIEERKAGASYYKTNIAYGYMLTHGFAVEAKKHITAKGRHVMQFKTTSGNWVTKERFGVKEYDFVEGPVRNWMNSPAFRDKIDNIMEARIRFIEKKIAQRKEAQNG